MVSSTPRESAQWSSRLTFILAAIGSAVGLGNLWRFSAEAGANGGGAFIAVYLVCVLFIGIPTILGELLIGRAGQANSAINSMRDLSNRSSVSAFWTSGAWAGVISAFLIVSFYCVVAAWVMAYITRFLGGSFDGQSAQQIADQFTTLIASPQDLIIYFLVFAGLVIWLVARGVNRGLELASTILMPLFFLLLLGLSMYSIVSAWSSGGTQQALEFMFRPDFSKLSPGIAISALGQSFFSLGLGMAIMITYGSYLPKSISIPKSAFIIGISDTMVALIAGLAIFPIVFQYGLDFEAGAGLFFQTLPTAMTSTPGGNFLGAAFFFMAMFAALTSAVSLLEPAAAHLSEQIGIKKSHAAVYLGLAMIALGMGSLYSLTFLDFLDKGLTAPLLLPYSALIVVCFVGWRLDKKLMNQELGEGDEKLAGFLVVMTKYVAPVMIAIILLAGIKDRYFPAG